MTARAVEKYFPESEETQKGHMTKDDVKIYNTADVEFTVKADAVLRG